MADGMIDSEMLPPGGGLKVAVAGPGRLRSSVWRIWGKKSTRDVYLAPLSAAGDFKVTLHESGQWQQSFLDQVAMTYVERNRDRHLEKWTRPAPTDGAITCAYYILVPRTEVRDSAESDRDVRFAPDPGPNGWVVIEVYLVEPNCQVELRSENGIQELGSIALPGGGYVWVVAHPLLPQPFIAKLMRGVREAMLSARDAGDPYIGRVTFEGPRQHTMAMQHTRGDDVRGVIEMALSEQPPEVRAICGGGMVEGQPVERPPFMRSSF